MSDEKVQEIKEVKSNGKLEKQVANLAFTVRKMKNYMEEKLGADIDGDGRIGGGPFKKALVFLLIAGMAAFCLAEDRTAIAYWSDNAKVTADGFVGVTIQPGVIVTSMLATAEAASLGLADTAIQPDEVYGVVSITGDAGVAGQLLLTNVVQTLAIDGVTSLTDYAVVHVWVSETDMGVAATNNIEALTLSGGTAVATVTADADYWYVTDSAGELTVVVEASAQDTTNYLMVAVGPQIESKALVFPAP